MLNDLYHMLDPRRNLGGPHHHLLVRPGLRGRRPAHSSRHVHRTQRRWGFNITIDDLTSVVVGVVDSHYRCAPVLRRLLR